MVYMEKEIIDGTETYSWPEGIWWSKMGDLHDCSAFFELMATGSDDGELRLWKVATDYKSARMFCQKKCSGAENVVPAVEKDARTHVIIILPVHYGEEQQMVENSQNGNQSGPRQTTSDSDGEKEEQEEDACLLVFIVFMFDRLSVQLPSFKFALSSPMFLKFRHPNVPHLSPNRSRSSRPSHISLTSGAIFPPIYMEPNTLLVHVASARGLYLKNHVTLDAFATVVLHGKGSLRSRAITEVVNTEADCRWDEHCEFKLNDKSSHITVTVSHKTKFGGADVIGKCEIPIEQAKRVGGHMWFALKKRKDDDKYRGEIQLQFTFSYEKPTLSISNTSLNKIEKDGMLDKMKRKLKVGKHKQAEDTMSMASGISGISMASSRSSRFISKIKTIGRSKKDVSDSSNDVNSSFESNGHLAPPTSNGAVRMRDERSNNASRPVSALSGIDFSEETYTPQNPLSISTPAAQGAQFTQNISGSPTASTAESFHRANSIRSVASSGFGGSNKQVKRRSDENTASQQDLLALVDSLRLELRVKESRLRDMEEYMDNLIMRVMERNPELLAAPLGPDKNKRNTTNNNCRYI
ncbi:unnamed protein product [Cylicocyclus nassatus]|uniref:C2 domain-containing protein n=1 Tax=Cylicocyclus nassatus TaxID=53992 RepID=A0AA36H7P1_CYLNA|nr:unnamed protein product [Cylicocyclus nassatus]